jgi:thiol-disulfide isomerase/thioredoxin
MKKLLFLMIFTSLLYSVQRVIVAEEFTGTWCTYCPGAARGLDELYERVYDSVVVIAYHVSDAFSIPEVSARSSYYGVSGVPSVFFDGIFSEVGGVHTGTMFPFYINKFSQRIDDPSPIDIDLTCTYDSDSNTGVVTAKITNFSGDTIDGVIHFVIVEDDIDYYWQGMDKLNFVARDMLPDASGETVSLPPGDSLITSRDFTISSNWNEDNCRIVVFVQGSYREIYQGAEIGVIPKSEMDYYGMNLTDSGGNGIAEPGESIELVPRFKNMGTGEFPGGNIIISTGDPYITITSNTSYLNPVGKGEVGSVSTPFTFEISPNCPDPHQLNLYFLQDTHTDTILFLITGQPGLSDDMESGGEGWSHFGTNDYWHLTEHESHSPSHSWYCGVEGLWHYTNENDASLVSSWFVVTPNCSLYFWHRYSLESGYDYGFFEMDNGSGWWKILDIFNGSQSSWVETSYPMMEYSGQTVRIRFRFISDYSVSEEGWYIDDLYVPSLSVSENPQNSGFFTHRFNVTPSISSSSFKITLSINSPSKVKIGVYDASGRLIENIFNSHLPWKGVKEIV